ncbi:MAG: YncE family protein, partial [Saccharothrix sp.]|nr:YncE family protein [Saccharothrix sp.]
MQKIRRRSARLGVLLTAGLIASTPVVATAAEWPVTYIRVGVNPLAVEISPNGALAYVANAYDRTVTAIDTASKSVAGTIPVGVQPQDIAFTPDSRKAYVTNAGDYNTDRGSVSVIDTASKQVVGTISVEPVNAPQAVAVTPDGTKAYVVGYGYTMAVIDTATNAVTPVSIGRSGATDIQVTPDGSRIYIADWDSNSVVVVSTATNAVIATV